MFRLVIVAVLAIAAMAMPFNQELNDEWSAFKTTHNKKYTTDEEPLRWI